MATPPQGYTASAVIDNGSPVVGGTVNGVLYVNSSGNLDSGNVLSFDGTNLSMASGQILMGDGSPSAPSYASADGATGVYFPSGTSIALAPGGVARAHFSGASVILGSTVTFGWSSNADPTAAGNDLILGRDAAGILHQRNSTNAQILRVANTYTSASVFEALELGWTSNLGYLRTMHTGASVRNLVFFLGNTTSEAMRIGTAASGGIVMGNYGTQTSVLTYRVGISGAGNVTATTGTHSEMTFDVNLAPSASSAMIARCLNLAPTINYSGGGAGQIKIAYFNPTVTAAPTGLSGSVVHSLSSSTLGGEIWHNLADEATNMSYAQIQWASNSFNILTQKAGSGAARGLRIGTGVEASLLFQVGGTDRWAMALTTYRLAAQGNYGFAHGTSALATTATEGFFHLQTCAGAPTGVPASIPTGQAPFVLDTANDRIYFYYDDGGGAGWHYVARTA